MPFHDTAQSSDRVRRRIQRGRGQRHYVYFAQCSDCRLIKIGFSRDYEQRLDELQRRSGHRDLTLQGVIWGTIWIEKQIQSMFLRDHVGGEWHRPSEALVAYIAREARMPARRGQPHD